MIVLFLEITSLILVRLETFSIIVILREIISTSFCINILINFNQLIDPG